MGGGISIFCRKELSIQVPDSASQCDDTISILALKTYLNSEVIHT